MDSNSLILPDGPIKDPIVERVYDYTKWHIALYGAVLSVIAGGLAIQKTLPWYLLISVVFLVIAGIAAGTLASYLSRREKWEGFLQLKTFPLVPDSVNSGLTMQTWMNIQHIGIWAAIFSGVIGGFIASMSPSPSSSSIVAMPSPSIIASAVTANSSPISSNPTTNHWEPKDAIAIAAGILSLISIAWQGWTYFHHRTEALLLQNLSDMATLERSLSDVPKAFQFHGLTEEQINGAGFTPEELAYLVSSFTIGGVFNRFNKKGSAMTFSKGGYRYILCSNDRVRDAWPLIESMMSNTPYKKRIVATLREIHGANFHEHMQLPTNEPAKP